jgi:hypothetical protein
MSFRPKTLRYPAKDSGRLTVLADFVKCKVETMSIYLLGSTIIEVWFGYHPPSNRCACKRQTCTNQHYEAESKNKGALNGYSDRSRCVRIKPSGEPPLRRPPKVSPAVRQMHPEALSIFRDAYTVEFLGLPPTHAEADLHRGLLDKLKDFLIELGRDFCFVGSEYPVQVGGRDFALDLLFFHRGLNCLVAIELKVRRFEPEYLGYGKPDVMKSAA